MAYDPKIHHRRSIRQPGKDYAQPGIYFVTIITKDRIRHFGQIHDQQMHLSEGGRVVESCWLAIPSFYPSVVLHAYAIMPDHFHGLIELLGPNHHVPPSPHPEILQQHRYQATIPKSLGAIVRSFKSGVTKWYRCEHPDITVWHRNYHEVEIQDDRHYQAVLGYIQNNPTKWTKGPAGHKPW